MTAWMRVEPLVGVGGDVGGDDQISESYCARWTHPLADVEYAVITRYYYVAAGDGPLRVEEQTEYIACTDPTEPGGTERGADYAYRTVPWSGLFDDAAARTAAGNAPEPTVAEWSEAMPRWEVA